ncbi:MAG TPA: UvrD-helicase domain-containing protein, partial [Terriglobia bacterium]|nr:UvrD-helicase domain-containing protein [Terriglobia bacterium]
MLIQRFLTLLATVEYPESIIAVTFTRKAAGEMRHRVIEALKKANESGENSPPEKEHERQTWELSRKVLAHDADRRWQLIQHPARLRIQTIDSLCGMLVRQMPWLSRMGAGVPPEENSEYLYREAARATVDMLEQNSPSAAPLERLLKHLDNNLGTVETLLSGMLRNRDHWLRHIVPNRGSAALRPALQTAMRRVIADELEDARARFPREIVPETIGFANFAARHLASENSASDIVRCAGLKDLPGSSFEHVPQWLGLAELFLTKDGKRRKALNVNTGFPPKPDCKEEKARCLALELPPESMAALHGVRSLPPDDFSDSQWEVLSALTELLPAAAAQLKVVFQQAGKVDFTEVAHASRIALGTRDNPTDLAFSLDCRIEHLLVDEFQDTSQGQFELLETLTMEWQPGDGRSLFLVGDPMQSIYGFREAEVALFLKARERGIGNVTLTPLTLSVNFRSNPGIVKWVNDELGRAFPAQPDRFRGAVTYEKSVAFRTGDETRGVHIHPSLDRDPVIEAAEVVSIVRKARASRPDDTIAVLVRSRSHLPAIINAFRGSSEKFTAVDIDRLGDRSVVQDLLALTAALLHAGDRAAWLAILRAPWCGLTLADLQSLVGQDFTSAIWDLLNDPSHLAEISPDGLRRIERIKPILAAAISERGRLPLRRWVEATWLALGGPACLENATGLEDAAVYLDLLESSAAGSDLRDTGRFFADVTGLFARPDVEADGKLQLLTIHKAKGLEFDTVILPGLGRSPRSDESRLLLWLEYIDRRNQSQLLLAPIKETGTENDPAYTYVQKIRNAKTENETTRLLYVAATRARSHLHLLGHAEVDPETAMVKPPASRTLLSRIWPAVLPKFELEAASHSRSPAMEAIEEAPAKPAVVPLRR